jgi:hypothetical protein
MFMALLGVGLGITALVTAFTKQAGGDSGEYVPTQEEIAGSNNLATLDAYHDLAAELYLRGRIDHSTYMALYNAYETRYYEILEAE